MSIGFFLERNAAVVWRGPMLHKAIQQFLEDVAWDELDYLLLDLPPGTGDVSMTLAQLLPQAKVVVVTTPQPAAQSVARRAAEMAGKVDLEVLGVIENMSGFTTPDGQRFTIFGEGGGQLLADELDVPLLGQGPALRGPARARRHAATPLVLADPHAPASIAIRDAARGIIAATPQELPVMQAETPAAPAPARRSAAPSCPSSRSRAERSGPALRDQSLVVGRARRRPRGERVLRRRRLPRRRLDPAAVRARGGRRRGRQAARPPAVPLRPRHAVVGARRRLGRRARLLRAGRARRRPSSPRRPASTPASCRPTSTTPSRRSAASASTSSTRASGRSTGFPTCRAGPGSSPSCSSPAASSTWPSSTRSPGCSPTTSSRSSSTTSTSRRASSFDDDEQGSYADLDVPTRNNATVEWAHTLADVVNAVLGAGLRLELLSEHDYTLFPRFTHLVEDRDLLSAGVVYRQPEGAPRLPLMYSLRARRDVAQRDCAVQLGPKPGRRLWAAGAVHVHHPDPGALLPEVEVLADELGGGEVGERDPGAVRGEDGAVVGVLVVGQRGSSPCRRRASCRARSSRPCPGSELKTSSGRRARSPARSPARR